MDLFLRKKKKKKDFSSCCGATGWVASLEGWDAGSILGQAQWPCCSCRSQLWLGSDPWPRSSICGQVARKEKRKTHPPHQNKTKKRFPWSAPALTNLVFQSCISGVQALCHPSSGRTLGLLQVCECWVFPPPWPVCLVL